MARNLKNKNNNNTLILIIFYSFLIILYNNSCELKSLPLYENVKKFLNQMLPFLYFRKKGLLTVVVNYLE